MISEAGVDIIVLSKNDLLNTKSCIESIHKTTPAPYNLIIVDQNSRDGSKEWLSKNKVGSHLIINNTDVSRQEAMNQGVKVGKYRWIVFVDSDLVIEDKCWIDKLWNYTLNKKCGFIDCLFKYRWGVNGNSGLSLGMVNRECLMEIGLFDKMLPESLMVEDFIVRLEWGGWVSSLCVDLEMLVNKSCLTPMKWELLDRKYDKTFIQDVATSFFERRVSKCQI